MKPERRSQTWNMQSVPPDISAMTQAEVKNYLIALQQFGQLVWEGYDPWTWNGVIVNSWFTQPEEER